MSTAGNPLTTAIFNPALLQKDDLIRGFVARQDVLERLIDDVRRYHDATAPQHQLVIGQRGLGKTTLLRRIAFAIEDDPELRSKWIPLVFPEEQYNVKNLADFWLNCADALSDALDRTGERAAAERLDELVEHVPVDAARRSEAALRVLLAEAERLGRGLVLLVDNLDIILDRLNGDEEWEFRRVISTEHRLYFIGASSRALEALYEHGRAFYDYFETHDLKGLTDEETFAVLRCLAEEAGDERVRGILKEKPGRIRALRVLTGGNPRTVVLLYKILAGGPEGDVQRDLEQLLDIYTPLYKSRFEDLAPQAQQVVDAVALHWDPVTASDLADRLAPLTVNQVSAQLTRLEYFGVVEKAPWYGEKKIAFQIAERLFNIWYLMRASRRVRRRLVWLAKFLEAWFEREELEERARGYLSRNPEEIGSERFAEMALAYSQAVRDRYLRRSLESAGLQAALDVSLTELIDFRDLPPELQDRKARMERLKDLRARLLELRFEGIDAAEFWRVLGGSPHLSLEEKTKVVAELPRLGPGGARELYAKLKRAEERFLRYGVDADTIARLYNALANGDMADVFDVDGSIAVARRWECPLLPWYGIAAKCLWFRERPPEDEFGKGERALRALADSPTYEASAMVWLGRLLTSAKRFEEAEAVLRRAVAAAPTNAEPFYRLGDLLKHVGRHQEAEDLYRRATEVNPSQPEAWGRLGFAAAESSRYEEAERAFRRAARINPHDTFVWFNLGKLLQRASRYREADEAYRRGIDADPQNSLAWCAFGNFLAAYLLADSAEHCFRRAVEVDPENDYCWFCLANQLMSKDDRHAEAFGALVRHFELSGGTNPELLIFLAKRSGEVRPALRAVTRAHELLPNDTSVRFARAGLLAQSGQWDEASAVLQQLAAKEDLENPDIWTFQIIVQAGHLLDALAILKRTGADQRWRPLYEALCAVQAGSADYLHRVAPEVRTIAREILGEIAPNIPKQKKPERGRSRRKTPAG